MVEAEQLSITFLRVTFQMLKAFLLQRKQAKVGLLSEIQFSDTLPFSGAFFLTLPTLYMSLPAVEPGPGPRLLAELWMQGEEEERGLSAWWCVSRLSTRLVISTFT